MENIEHSTSNAEKKHGECRVLNHGWTLMNTDTESVKYANHANTAFWIQPSLPRRSLGEDGSLFLC
jgi:hypothetical protein